MLTQFKLVLQSVAPPSWKGAGSAGSWIGSNQRTAISLPTLEQRERIFSLLGTLTGHHTRYCLRKAQPAYRKQVYERYEPLVGYAHKAHRRGPISALKRIVPGMVKRRLFDEVKDDKEVEKIFGSPERDARNKELSNGHKYYFAINLVRRVFARRDCVPLPS